MGHLKTIYLTLTTIMMITVLIGGFRIARGPSPVDRMLAAQFLTTTAVAIFLLLAEALNLPELRNVSLVMVSLSTITTVAFVKIYGPRKGKKE